MRQQRAWGPAPCLWVSARTSREARVGENSSKPHNPKTKTQTDWRAAKGRPQSWSKGWTLCPTRKDWSFSFIHPAGGWRGTHHSFLVTGGYEEAGVLSLTTSQKNDPSPPLWNNKTKHLQPFQSQPSKLPFSLPLRGGTKPEQPKILGLAWEPSQSELLLPTRSTGFGNVSITIVLWVRLIPSISKKTMPPKFNLTESYMNTTPKIEPSNVLIRGNVCFLLRGSVTWLEILQNIDKAFSNTTKQTFFFFFLGFLEFSLMFLFPFWISSCCWKPHQHPHFPEEVQNK